MKVRIHFTTNTGTESHVDYTSKTVVVLNESARQDLLEQFWFDYGAQAVDGVELVKE